MIRVITQYLIQCNPDATQKKFIAPEALKHKTKLHRMQAHVLVVFDVAYIPTCTSHDSALPPFTFKAANVVPTFAVEKFEDLDGIGALWDILIADGGFMDDSKTPGKAVAEVSTAGQLAVNLLSQVHLSVAEKSLESSCSNLTDRCLEVSIELLT